MVNFCGDAVAIPRLSQGSTRLNRAPGPVSQEATVTADQHVTKDLSVAIVGAGPVGLLVAIALFRRGFRKLRVFDRLPKPPSPDATAWGNAERSYNLGIGDRGQKSLKRFEVFERVDRWSQTVFGRMGYSQDGTPPTTTLQKKRSPSRIIARDRLSSCIYEELGVSCPGVEIDFSIECADVTFDSHGATLTLQRCVAPESNADASIASAGDDEECQTDAGPFEVQADVVIGADGVNSQVREAMQKAGASTKKTVFKDRRPTAYKTLPITMPQDARVDLNYSTRKGAIGIEALPNVEGTLGGVLLCRPADKRILDMESAENARHTEVVVRQ